MYSGGGHFESLLIRGGVQTIPQMCPQDLSSTYQRPCVPDLVISAKCEHFKVKQ